MTPLNITPETPPKLKTIPGFPLYAITQDGRVWSDVSDRFIKSFPNKRGYPQIRLSISRGGEKETVFIHCLVAAAWIGPRPDGLDCAHLDGNPANPHVSNPTYVTRKENMGHAVTHGTRIRGETVGSARLTEEQVLEIYRRRHAGERSIKLAREFGVSHTCIYDIKSGNKWKYLTQKSA